MFIYIENPVVFIWTLSTVSIKKELGLFFHQAKLKDFLLWTLIETVHDTPQDMVDAYPSGTQLRRTGINQFEAGVQALFAINDYQRRRVSEHFRKYKNMVSASFSYT